LSKSLLLRGGRVVTLDSSRRILDADVLVEDGRISEVGRSDGHAVGRSKPTTIDCTGLIILPGLVQAHIHLCQTLFRGLADDLSLENWLAQRIWPLEAAHTETSIHASAMLGAAELMLGGTTAILDMETVRHTGAAFEALESIGLRATVGKCLMDAPSNPASLRESTDEALTESSDLCARWHGAAGGRLRYCFAPRFAPSCTGPLLRAVSDLAEKAGAVIHTHAAETPMELDIVKRETGHDEIAYLDSVGISGPRTALAHCVWVDTDGIARLARQQTNVVHCPSSNLKLGSGLAPIPEMLKAGCRVAIGADGAPCNNRLDGFAEMRLAALIHKPRLGPEVMPAAQVLELATLGGARALGLEAAIGSIEVGKCADLIALDLAGPHAQPDGADLVSRIVYSAGAADVRHVIVDGRIVVRDGELKTADLANIRATANTEARRLAAAVAVHTKSPDRLRQ
jgi:cytosine/adenosine deaminase-related metal-dependent hydrolase